MIEILGVREGSEEEREKILARQTQNRKTIRKTTDPYQRTKAAVYSSGNKWAIENFEATH